MSRDAAFPSAYPSSFTGSPRTYMEQCSQPLFSPSLSFSLSILCYILLIIQSSIRIELLHRLKKDREKVQDPQPTKKSAETKEERTRNPVSPTNSNHTRNPLLFPRCTHGTGSSANASHTSQHSGHSTSQSGSCWCLHTSRRSCNTCMTSTNCTLHNCSSCTTAVQHEARRSTERTQTS